MIWIIFIGLAIWILTGYLQDMAKHKMEYDQAIREENKSSNDIHLNQYNYGCDENSENHRVVKHIENLGEN